MAQKVWFITGVSSGFGRVLLDAVIAQGDIAVGTLRSDAQIADFTKQYGSKAHAVKMDVTDAAAVQAGVASVIKQHGRIDVLVNNAGFGLMGAIEETSIAEYRAQMETNFFGVINVTQAVLPSMRAAKAGHIVQLSSVAGITSGPGFGPYCASKFALEALSEALAKEVEPLGIKVMLVEPGPFRTKFAGSSMKRAAKQMADYAETAQARITWMESIDGKQEGDPVKACRVILQAVAGKTPLRLPLGNSAITRIREKLASVEADIKAWEKLSLDTNCDDIAA